MGAYLSEPVTEKSIKEGKAGSIPFCVAEMQGWRKFMEDAAIATDLGDSNSLFAVFDGHGGSEVSCIVKRQFAKTLTNLVEYKSKQYKKALVEAFRLTDEQLLSSEVSKILQDLRSSKEDVAMNTGCTANVVLVTPTQIFVANAGDSRSVLCRDGKAVDLSLDHKPSLIKEENRIKKAGGVISMGRVNGGLNLTRSFGDFSYKQQSSLRFDQQMITCNPDVKRFQRETSDEFILLGCDGIWERYVENSQGLISIVKGELAYKSNKEVLVHMLDQLLAKETTEGIGCDNMTAIIVRLQ